MTKRVLSTTPNKGVKGFIQNDPRVSISSKGAFAQVKHTYYLSQRWHGLASIGWVSLSAENKVPPYTQVTGHTVFMKIGQIKYVFT